MCETLGLNLRSKEASHKGLQINCKRPAEKVERSVCVFSVASPPLKAMFFRKQLSKCFTAANKGKLSHIHRPLLKNKRRKIREKEENKRIGETK